MSGEKEGGSKVGSIDSYYCGTVALEGEKIRAFAVVFYFINFRFRQVQHKALQVRCGLCKCAAVWPLRTWFPQFFNRSALAKLYARQHWIPHRAVKLVIQSVPTNGSSGFV